MENIKEKLRQGVRLARSKFDQKEVADQIGCSESHLSTFMNGGAFGPDPVNRLEAWLKKEGFWPKEEPVLTPDNVSVDTYAMPSYADPSDAFSTIAFRLISLGRFLADPNLPEEVRAKEFTVSIETLHDSLDKIRAALERPKVRIRKPDVHHDDNPKT